MTDLVGKRLSVGGKRATVCYVGEIDDQEGQWVGLDWDDRSRGKHDGSYGGRRYFSCRNGQASASFMRHEKFLACMDPALSIADAIRIRYAGPRETTADQKDDMFVKTSSNRIVPVQLVVLENSDILDHLSSVALGGLNVEHVVRQAALTPRFGSVASHLDVLPCRRMHAR